MDEESKIKRLILALYQEIGGNPDYIAQIKPRDGGWGTALTYEVSNRNGEIARLFRSMIDDKEYGKIKSVLRYIL